MTFPEWIIFVGIWFAAGLPLGPNAANCIAVSAGQGFRRSLWAVGGVLASGAIMMAVVILGLGAVLLANQLLFTVLKIAGAAYLVWMGITLIRRGGGGFDMDAADPEPAVWVLRRAMMISFSNPKALIAYGAVFSQFIDGNLAALWVIVPTALMINAIIYLGYAGLGLGVAKFLGSAVRRRWFNRGIGSFYVVAGAGLLAQEMTGARR